MSSLPLIPDSVDPPKLVGIARLAAEGECLREGHNVEYFTLASRSLLSRVVSRRDCSTKLDNWAEQASRYLGVSAGACVAGKILISAKNLL